MANPLAFQVLEIEKKVLNKLDLKTLINYRSINKFYHNFYVIQMFIISKQDEDIDDTNKLMQLVCKLGFTSLFKRIYGSLNEKMAKQINFDMIFRLCCRFGRVDIAKWIIQAVRIRHDMFYNACINDQVGMLKILYEYCPNLIDKKALLKISITGNKIKSGKWLLEGFKENKRDIFLRCCQENKLEYAQMIYSIDYISRKLMRSAIKSSNAPRVIEWLNSIYKKNDPFIGSQGNLNLSDKN